MLCCSSGMTTQTIKNQQYDHVCTHRYWGLKYDLLVLGKYREVFVWNYCLLQ